MRTCNSGIAAASAALSSVACADKTNSKVAVHIAIAGMGAILEQNAIGLAAAGRLVYGTADALSARNGLLRYCRRAGDSRRSLCTGCADATEGRCRGIRVHRRTR